MQSISKMSKSEAGKLGYLKSKESQEKNKSKRIAEYNNNPKKCPHCDAIIPYAKRRNKFCSHSCSASSHNIGTCRNGVSSTSKCLNCNTLLDRNNRKFCNHKCHSEYRWKTTRSEIESGVYMERVSENTIRETIKRYLIEKNGHQCEICKAKRWMGQEIPLVCDHIDGNATNNNLENFRLVCGNCDMQLPTYKSKNRGNGRKYRRSENTTL